MKEKPGTKKGELVALSNSVEERIRALVADNPDAISYDPRDPANELLHIRVLTDPGILAAERDGWCGVVKGWAVGTWVVTDPETQELVTLPSLALIDSERNVVRLTGWPAINSLAQILKAAGPDRVRAGLPVTIMRRPSGTAGRSYWTIQVDDRANGGSNA